MSTIKSIEDLLVIAQDPEYLPLHLLLDTNIILGFIDESDKLNGTVRPIISALINYQATFYFVLPSRLELMEKWRRKAITDYLRSNLNRENPETYSARDSFPKTWKLWQKVAQGRRLDDKQIKIIRDWCLNCPGGIELWHQFTMEALGGEFLRLDKILQKAGINYVSYGHPIYGAATTRPQWESAYALMEEFGLGSNDAAILNMCTNASGLSGIVTADKDFSSAIEADAISRLTCFFLDV